MVTVLVLLLGVAAIAAIAWNYRRQAAAREAASAERMKAFLEQARGAAARPADGAGAVPPAQVAARVAQPRALVSGFIARVPLLSTEQQALFVLLRNAMPDHEIFARVSLAAFVQPAATVTGFAREAQERRLADAVADFVVCDRASKVLAAVQCGARSGKAAETAAFAEACVIAVGMRWMEVSPQALPRAEEIRRRLLGA